MGLGLNPISSSLGVGGEGPQLALLFPQTPHLRGSVQPVISGWRRESAREPGLAKVTETGHLGQVAEEGEVGGMGESSDLPSTYRPAPYLATCSLPGDK